MELYFLRHAIAAERGGPKYTDDGLRPLTAQGREKMHHASLGMLALGLKFDTFLTSPFLRARQTAEIVARAYKMKNKKIHITNNLLPPASIEELLREIQNHFPKSKNILLIGHEPHLTQMISCLLKCSNPLEIDFKKGGLCCLSVKYPLGNENAILNWLLTPTQLGLMAK
jgi:phosphohistidine phosphatase